MAIFGGTYGSLGHNFYGFIESKLKQQAVGIKLLLDQAIFSPLISCTLLTFIYLSKGCSPAVIAEHIIDKLPQLCFVSLFIWIPTHALNSFAVPKKFRLLYFNIIQIFHCTILSAVSH
jgi:hypothetical protein